MKYATPQQRIQANELKMCKAKGCTRHRKFYSGYCSSHNAFKVAYGDPEQRRVYPKAYEREALKVQHLVQANSQHPGIQQGAAFFQDWLTQATQVSGVLAQRAILRLSDEGISGMELLQEVAALWLFCRMYPWSLQEGLPLDYATGIAVLCKAHNKRGTVSCQRIKSAERRKVGQYVRDHIGRLLHNITRTIQDQEKEEELARQAMSLPFGKGGGDTHH